MNIHEPFEERHGKDRFEAKYLIPLPKADFVGEWLLHYALPDPRYPDGIVSSLYLDTPRLRLYREKLDSDLRKTKVRLRWYDTPGNGSAQVFLEVKQKEGRRVFKAREQLELDEGELARLCRGEEMRPELQPKAEALAGCGLGLLVPVCVIRYRRRRYMDPRTGYRVSLDEGIGIALASHTLFPYGEAATMDQAVLEVKGNGVFPERPHEVLPKARLDAVSESFSKYAAGVDLLIAGGG